MEVYRYTVQSSRFRFLYDVFPQRWHGQSPHMKLPRLEEDAASIHKEAIFIPWDEVGQPVVARAIEQDGGRCESTCEYHQEPRKEQHADLTSAQGVWLGHSCSTVLVFQWRRNYRMTRSGDHKDIIYSGFWILWRLKGTAVGDRYVPPWDWESCWANEIHLLLADRVRNEELENDTIDGPGAVVGDGGAHAWKFRRRR